MMQKKDAYIPALRVPEDFADRAQAAVAKMEIDAPSIRREWWGDLIKIGDSGEHLIRPVRLATTELVAAIAQSSSPDDIERIFHRPPPHFGIIKMTATIAAASAVAMCAFMAGRMLAPARTEAVERVAMATPTPTVSTQTATASVSSSQVVAAPPVAVATPTPAAAAPLRTLAKRPEPEQTIKARHVPLIAKETKSEAVKRASKTWDDREKSIDRKLHDVDKKLANAPEGRKRSLIERQSLLMQSKDYVRRSRTHDKDEARLAWDKAHGASTAWDHLLASLGF